MGGCPAGTWRAPAELCPLGAASSLCLPGAAPRVASCLCVWKGCRMGLAAQHPFTFLLAKAPGQSWDHQPDPKLLVLVVCPALWLGAGTLPRPVSGQTRVPPPMSQHLIQECAADPRLCHEVAQGLCLELSEMLSCPERVLR